MQNRFAVNFETLSSICHCPRSSYPFYIGTYFIERVTTSWIDSIHNISKKDPDTTGILTGIFFLESKELMKNKNKLSIGSKLELEKGKQTIGQSDKQKSR